MQAGIDDRFPGFTPERAAQGEAMWAREGARLRRLGIFPMLAGTLSISSFVALTLFFSGAGRACGVAADLLSVGVALALVMTAHALRILQSDRAPELGRRTTYFGMTAAILLASSSTSVLLKDPALVVFPEPFPRTGPLGLSLIAVAMIGLWLLVAGCPGRSNWVISRALTWAGVLAGLLLIITSALFAALGPQHPATAVVYFGAGALLPTWSIWLGVTMLRGETGWRAATASLLSTKNSA